jgi:low affinity Fe/Cu permease
MNWEHILEIVAGSGVWAAMFVSLFFVQLRDTKTREQKYQETIKQLAESFNIVVDIKKDVGDLKSLINRKS